MSHFGLQMAFEGNKDQNMRRAKSDCTMVNTSNNNGEIQHKMPLNSLFVAFLGFDLAFRDLDDGKGLNMT